MKFDYNEDLNEVERIEQVTIEIKRQYPLIGNKAALAAASLETSHDDKPTNEEKFQRYYLILQNLNPNNIEYLHIYNDLCDLYEEGIDNSAYDECMREITNYVSGNRDTFPELADCYA